MPSISMVSKEEANGTGAGWRDFVGAQMLRPYRRVGVRRGQQLPARSAQAAFSSEVKRLSGIDAPCVFTGAAVLP